MSAVFKFLNQWALAISISLACLLVILETNGLIEYKCLNDLKLLICNIYYNNHICSTNDFEMLIISFLSISISILFFLYVFFFCVLFIFKLNSHKNKKIDPPNILYKYQLAQLFVSFFILSVLWGNKGVFYFDSYLIASAITFSVFLILELLLYKYYLIIEYLFNRMGI